MKERVLVDFLEGRASAADLAENLAHAYVQEGLDTWALHVEPVEETYTVTRQGLIRLCDAVLAGDIAPDLLEPVGDCLMLSEAPTFDEADRDLLAEVAHRWGAPEINGRLDLDAVRMFREGLAAGRLPG